MNSYRGQVAAVISDRAPSTYEIAGATLNGAIDDVVTTIPFTGQLKDGDVIRIGTEQMLVGTVTPPNATVTRGYNNTTPAAHSLNDKIAKRFPSDPDVMLFSVKGVKANSDVVYIGDQNVVISDGTQLDNTGFEVEPSQETLYMPINNMNLLWSIRTADTDLLSVIVIRTPAPTS